MTMSEKTLVMTVAASAGAVTLGWAGLLGYGAWRIMDALI